MMFLDAKTISFNAGMSTIEEQYKARQGKSKLNHLYGDISTRTDKRIKSTFLSLILKDIINVVKRVYMCTTCSKASINLTMTASRQYQFVKNMMEMLITRNQTRLYMT